MSQYMQNMQLKLKSSSNGMVLLGFKLLSGLILGLTFALIGEEIIGYGKFSFTFVVILSIFGLLRIAKKWRYVGVFVFDLVCVLIGLLLRMYILIAPGA
ncbi:MAG: hypothetical protein KDD50_02345 [Bdellovibrionales bacterium]|nr:hypothetical protein [Bdellovibrionales bacterium]